jgi:tripartite-type tricarboxylate transporter receptor subunit TctC
MMSEGLDTAANGGGIQLVGNTPEEFARVIKSDLAKYAKLVKAANIQVQ